LEKIGHATNVEQQEKLLGVLEKALKEVEELAEPPSDTPRT